MGDETRERINAFKVGFLRKLAEEGITPDEFHEHVKQAFDPMAAAVAGAGGAADVGTKLVGAGADVGGALLKNLAYAGVLAPMALGGTAGAIEARLTSPSVEDVEAMRRAELAAKYEQMARVIRQRLRAKRGA